MADDAGGIDQELVAEDGVDAEARGHLEEPLAEELLRRAQGRLAGRPLVALEPLLHRPHQHEVEEDERDQQQEGVDDHQPLGVGAHGTPRQVAEGGARERQEQERRRGEGEQDEDAQAPVAGALQGLDRLLEREIDHLPPSRRGAGPGAGPPRRGLHLRLRRPAPGAAQLGGERRILFPRRQGGAAVRPIEGIERRLGDLLDGVGARPALEQPHVHLAQAPGITGLEAGARQQPVADGPPGAAAEAQGDGVGDQEAPPLPQRQAQIVQAGRVDDPLVGQRHAEGEEGRRGASPAAPREPRASGSGPAGSPPEDVGEILVVEPGGRPGDHALQVLRLEMRAELGRDGGDLSLARRRQAPQKLARGIVAQPQPVGGLAGAGGGEDGHQDQADEREPLAQPPLVGVDGGQGAARGEQRQTEERTVAEDGAAEQQGHGDPGHAVPRHPLRPRRAPPGQAEEAEGGAGEPEPQGERAGGDENAAGEVERPPEALDPPGGEEEDAGPGRSLDPGRHAALLPRAGPGAQGGDRQAAQQHPHRMRRHGQRRPQGDQPARRQRAGQARRPVVGEQRPAAAARPAAGAAPRPRGGRGRRRPTPAGPPAASRWGGGSPSSAPPPASASRRA